MGNRGEDLVEFVVDVETFAEQARTWLAEAGADAPVDYGAICPPELIEAGIAWQRRLFDAGFAGIHWPVEHGGRGLTPEHNSVWLLECARAGVPGILNMVGLVLAGGAINAYGTEEQKATHLRATLNAEHVWCQLFSEPDAGSDLASLTTRAERHGDAFVVNGQKVWCSGGRISNWGILLARTNPESPQHATSKHDGISFFLCPMDLPGIEVRPLRQMTGGSEFDEVFFNDVAIPAEHQLGPLHGGWGVAMSVLTSERGHIGTSVIALERRLEKLEELGRYGDHPLTASQRQEFVRLVSLGSAFRALAKRQQDSNGAAATTAGSLLKLGVSEMMFDVARLKADIAGAEGMLDGARELLGAPGARIAGGTSQIQRTIIGERLLGLPREPTQRATAPSTNAVSASK